MALQLPSFAEDILYPSWQMRSVMKSLGIQAGVVESEDYKVTAGTGLQVNVKKGNAWVAQTGATQESSNVFYNGLYQVPNPTEINPSNAVEVSSANPQIAQIILRVYDVNELKIGGSSYARIEWLNGTPNVNATEAKMKEKIYEGAAVLPQSSFRIARVLVPKNATKSSEYFIQDARTFANEIKGGTIAEESIENSQIKKETIETNRIKNEAIKGPQLFKGAGGAISGESMGAVVGRSEQSFNTVYTLSVSRPSLANIDIGVIPSGTSGIGCMLYVNGSPYQEFFVELGGSQARLGASFDLRANENFEVVYGGELSGGAKCVGLHLAYRIL